MSSQQHEQGSYFQFLPQQRVSEAKDQGGCQLPSQPQPHGAHPPHPEPRPTYLEGARVPRSPSSRSGAGARKGHAWLPHYSSLLAPGPSERSCCLRQGAAAWPRWGEARRQGRAGPGKTSSQDQEWGDTALLGGPFPRSKPAAPEGDQGGKDKKRQHRASDSHSGFAATFTISREQEADSKKGKDSPAPL